MQTPPPPTTTTTTTYFGITTLCQAAKLNKGHLDCFLCYTDQPQKNWSFLTCLRSVGLSVSEMSVLFTTEEDVCNPFPHDNLGYAWSGHLTIKHDQKLLQMKKFIGLRVLQFSELYLQLIFYVR